MIKKLNFIENYLEASIETLKYDNLNRCKGFIKRERKELRTCNARDSSATYLR